MVETRSSAAKRRRREEEASNGTAKKRRTAAREPVRAKTDGAVKKQRAVARSPSPEEEEERDIEAPEQGGVDLVALYDALGKTAQYAEALQMMEGMDRKQLLAPIAGKEKDNAPNVLSRVFQADAVYNREAGKILDQIVRKTLPLTTPADLLQPRNLVKDGIRGVQAKEDVFVEIIEMCKGAAEFTDAARKELLTHAMLHEWARATAVLVDGIDSSFKWQLEFLKLPIVHNKRVTLEVLLDKLPSGTNRAISSRLLDTALKQFKYDIAHVIIDRFPESLRIPVTTHGVYMGAIHACELDHNSMAGIPPIALWRKMVDGTPDGLLFLQIDGSKDTILHIAIRQFPLEHVEALLAKFTAATCSLKNAKGLTAADLANRRKAGKYEFCLQAQFNAQGKEILRLLTVGAHTKSAV